MLDNDSNLTQAYLRQESEDRISRNKAAQEKFVSQRANAKKADAKRESIVKVADERAKGKPVRWRLGHTFGLLFLMAFIVAACALFPRWASGVTVGISLGTWRLGLWLLLVALLGGSFVLIGHGVVGLANGCLIDNRNRLSLSRLQQFSWTVLVFRHGRFGSYDGSSTISG